MCSTLPACAVLTELRNRDSIKAIADYAGLPSTHKETKVLASLMPLKFCTSNPPVFDTIILPSQINDDFRGTDMVAIASFSNKKSLQRSQLRHCNAFWHISVSTQR